jgi:hypothetical protein
MVSKAQGEAFERDLLWFDETNEVDETDGNVDSWISQPAKSARRRCKNQICVAVRLPNTYLLPRKSE